jgi:hypothetical protein
MGVLLEGTEEAKDHINSNVVNKDPDFEEFTLISNSVAELVNEGGAAASITGMLFPAPLPLVAYIVVDGKVKKRKAGATAGGQKKKQKTT